MPDPHPDIVRPDAGAAAPVSVLIVSPDRGECQRMTRRFRAQRMCCAAVPSLAEAKQALANRDFDAALIRWDLPDGSGVDLVRRIHSGGSGVVPILLAADPTVDDAVRAMRSGAADLIRAATPPAQVVDRVRAAVCAARARRRRLRRVLRVAHQLNDARRQVTEQVGSLCNHLVDAYQELSDQMSQVKIATEFDALVRQELDVEELLRTVLEFVLAKTGPTNAAVFLPSTSSEFSLGAYINYTCPRDSADVLLDHLAATLAPRFEEETEILTFDTTDQLAELIGDSLDWMGDSAAVVFSCRHDDECLAVVTLFRDRASSFGESALELCRVVQSLFARQLARVIRIHHRHLPRDQWDPFGQQDDGLGDIDLAA